MAGEREFETAADAGALDRAGYRLAAGFEATEQLVEDENLVEDGGGGRTAAILGREHGAEIFKVHTGHEAAVLARCDDCALDRFLGRDAGDGGVEIGQEVGADDVHRLVGNVDRQRGDAVGVGGECDGLHDDAASSNSVRPE